MYSFLNFLSWVSYSLSNVNFILLLYSLFSFSLSILKIFGIKLLVYKDGILVKERELKYKEKSSLATSDAKPGWNYTKAGFWFEELEDLENVTIKVQLIEGSPEIEVKLIVEPISLRISVDELKPITLQKEYVVQYIDNANDSLLKSSDNWYLISDISPLQFKIKGPKNIRFISRKKIFEDDNQNYSFILREDGKYISRYSYLANSSNFDAKIKGSSTNVSIEDDCYNYQRT